MVEKSTADGGAREQKTIVKNEKCTVKYDFTEKNC